MRFQSSVLFALALILTTGLAISPAAHGQAVATCTFTTFNPPSGFKNGDFFAYGINHYNTVVGVAFTGGDGSPGKAFIRYSGGGVTLFAVPNFATTELYKRNINGVSVGQYYSGSSMNPGFPGPGSHGLMLTSKSFATLDYPGADSTVANGINKSNVIVGNWRNSSTSASSGFKYQNGKFSQIKFPGAVQTTAVVINDQGAIFGQYELGSFENPWSAYMLQSGKFTTIKFSPSDINSSGVMVGGNEIRFTNGTIKQVSVPGSNETRVNGINDLGKITGSAHFGGTPGTWQGFIATCH